MLLPRVESIKQSKNNENLSKSEHGNIKLKWNYRSLVCPSCRTRLILKNPNYSLGKKIKCPKCGNFEILTCYTNQKFDRITLTVNDIECNFHLVTKGQFMMGSNKIYSWLTERPMHKVIFEDDFFIGETVVTQDLWFAIMGTNPSNKVEPLKPVVNVSWYDCQHFINKLNGMINDERFINYHFRLPTEAEWEYSARGGNPPDNYDYCGSNNLDDVGWYTGNCDKLQNVKLLKPNKLGLYDMSGNVKEWCEDWYGDYSPEIQINPTGPKSGKGKVVRGGGFCSEGTWMGHILGDGDLNAYYVSGRGEIILSPDHASCDIGFRLVLCKGTDEITNS